MRNAREICKARGGDWHGQFGLCPGPGHSPRDRSVKIWTGPDGSVMVHSFAGDSWQDIKAALCVQGLLPEWRDIKNRNPHAIEKCRQQTQERQQRGKKHLARKAEKTLVARASFRRAIPLAETSGDTFLVSRGLTAPWPVSLRFTPSLIHPYVNLPFPAIIAAVQAADRSIQATQNTYLLPDGRGKARLSAPRLPKGPLKGGTVRLAAAGEILGLAEGVETGLAAMQMFGVPIWCCLGGSNIKNAPVPGTTKQIIIYGDNGDAGHRYAEEAAEVFALQGRKVKLAFPVEPHGDFNDALLSKETAA